MYLIGLTGNIATGKSTITGMLRCMGAFVIDADKLAHEVMTAGSQAHEQIVARFGDRVVGADGEIDRAELGQIVFSDPAALHDLEAIVHPLVAKKTLAQLEGCRETVGVIEAIKLIDTKMHRLCDAVWVVTCSREQQLSRLVQTRHLSPQAAELRIDAQPAPEIKLAQADVVIDNSGTLQETRRQVQDAWKVIPALPLPGTHTAADGDSCRDQIGE